MNGWKVMIVALQGHMQSAAEWRSRLLSLAAPAHSTLAVHTALAADLYAHDLAALDAVILLGDGPGWTSAASTLLDLAEDPGFAVIAFVDQSKETRAFCESTGVLAIESNLDHSCVWSIMRGVLHRQSEIKRLKTEATLTQRFQGGLKGEIARMHEELQLAALVQREFLPREAPVLHAVEFAALWRPTNYVSGDIYDLIHLDDDRIGVFIADAVGHGVPAALMTMVICRSLITKEIEGGDVHILSPSDVLSRLNQEMIRRQGRTIRFSTAVYAVLDCRQRTLQLAGAGHPPPLLLKDDGATRSLETNGGLLGVFADETYDQIELELDVNDRLLFYTDGFEQAFPASANDQHHRRMPTTQYRREFDLLRQPPTAAAMVEALTERVDDQAGSLHQVDDLTMICVRAGALAGIEARERTSPMERALRIAAGHATGGLRLAT